MSLGNLYDNGVTIYRELAARDDTVLVIDCVKRTMPVWLPKDRLTDWQQIEEQALHEKTGILPLTEDALSKSALACAHKRYSMIAPAVAVVTDKKQRNDMIIWVSNEYGISKQTVRKYLCLFLVYQTVSILAPIDSTNEALLSKEQKWMRWALNKYFYTCRQNSLKTAYLFLLKEKYLDESGQLKKEHPSYYQFRYFYRRTKNQQNFLISRKGLTEYQRNHRPLLGEGVAEFANHVGIAMLDSTLCDIYLVDEVGSLLGRPILTACVDAYSQMCCGYALTWEGGMVSLRSLMENVITDKAFYCKQNGIMIKSEEWDCSQLPGVMVTDRGMKYCSENFEQLSELGVTIINLPSYRPELKGIIEKFFDLIQCYFKPYLKGRGVIEPDYQQRGAHDYRLDACLTLEDFQKVILRCIVHYNSKRVKPFPNELWNFGRTQPGSNLISVDHENLKMTMKPRTFGEFTRKGLKANGLRYKCDGFTERYLKGDSCVISYDPNDVSYVWLVEKGKYTRFELIERRFIHKSLAEVESMQMRAKELASINENQGIQAEIDLSNHITAIGDTAKQLRKK